MEKYFRNGDIKFGSSLLLVHPSLQLSACEISIQYDQIFVSNINLQFKIQNNIFRTNGSQKQYIGYFVFQNKIFQNFKFQNKWQLEQKILVHIFLVTLFWDKLFYKRLFYKSYFDKFGFRTFYFRILDFRIFSFRNVILELLFWNFFHLEERFFRTSLPASNYYGPNGRIYKN